MYSNTLIHAYSYRRSSVHKTSESVAFRYGFIRNKGPSPRCNFHFSRTSLKSPKGAVTERKGRDV